MPRWAEDEASALGVFCDLWAADDAASSPQTQRAKTQSQEDFAALNLAMEKWRS
jgi:hypothetical protein